MWINYQVTSLKVISLIGIDVTIPWSVCLRRLCTVLRQQMILTQFLVHTTVSYLPSLTLVNPFHPKMTHLLFI